MKRSYNLIFLLILLFIINTISAQSSIHVKISLKSDLVLKDSSVFIAGSLQSLGYWQPDSVKMDYEGNNSWSIDFVIEEPMIIEYKFTLGSWNNEAVDSNGYALSNFKVNINRDTAIHHEIKNWMDGKQKRKVIGQITGTVKYHSGMKGEGIKNRDVIVWLPPDYESNKEKRYPVLYLQDGQNIIDPSTSNPGIDWGVDEVVDSLIRNQIIEPIIIVGIYNTADRRKEYTPGVLGNNYMNFIVSTLKPFIDDNYRTKSDRLNTYVGGSSAGGIFAFMIAHKFYDIFSGAICMSPAFKYIDWNYAEVFRNSEPTKNRVYYYLDNGNDKVDNIIQPGVDEMLVALKGKGLKEGKDFDYLYFPNDTHFETSWGKRFPDAIKMVMEKSR